jgi:hypothetical protein
MDWLCVTLVSCVQVDTGLMIICDEPSGAEWKTLALSRLTHPDHQNHIMQIWTPLSSLLTPHLADKLADIDGTNQSDDMQERLKAELHIMQGVRRCICCNSVMHAIGSGFAHNAMLHGTTYSALRPVC